MKSINYFLAVMSVLFLFGCSVSRHSAPVIRGGEKEAIEIVVNDFLKKCYLRRHDKVFSVYIDNENPNYLGVGIFGVSWSKLFVTPEVKVGEKSIFPTQYIEKKGKLFYWDDSTKVLTEEIVAALSRYDHIDSTYADVALNSNEMMVWYSVDESKKGIDYYFCRDNLAIFKKVITSRAIGGHETPQLKCKE